MEWLNIIKEEQEKEYYKQLDNRLVLLYKTKTIFPEKNKIFKAFELTKYSNLKVVILGQDPYHGSGQAQGLAFSTPNNVKNPPSMVNIFKEIKNDLGFESKCLNGDLHSWAEQGILLINSILTVEESKPKSHHKLGWEVFTDNIIKYINKNNENIIFVFWGNSSINKRKLIDENKNFVLIAPHPSPLSAYRGFFGCKHFSRINNILKKIGKKEIIW